MSKDLIVKHNKVIESKYNMTSTEAKIIAKLTCMIKKNDEEFKKYTFRSIDLLQELGLGTTNYVALRKAINKLITRKIKIHQSGKKELVTTFLSSCIYDNKNSTVTLSYDPELKPYFLQLKKNFTKYYLENILELKSFYSIRIYELLKQYQKLKERRIELEKLKEILDAKQKSYNKYNNFKRKVLLKAKKEINEKTDLEVDFEEIKTGRKVTAIKFIIKQKESTKKKIEDKDISQAKTYSKEVLELFELLPEEEQVAANKKELDRLLKEHSYEYLKADIEYVKKSNPENFMAFLNSSCPKSHYSAAQMEKKEKKKELAQKRKEEEQRKRELEEKIEQKAYEKAVERYDKLSEEKLKEYGIKYKKLSNFLRKKVSKKGFIIGALQEEVREELRDFLSVIDD